MMKSSDINKQIQKKILQGAKTPHSTSYPVIVRWMGIFTR